MINFWNRIITGKQSKIAHVLYCALRATPNFESKWLKCIKEILCDAGRPDLWDKQNDICSKNISKIIKKVQVGKDQEKAQSEKDSHSKNRGGKKTN